MISEKPKKEPAQGICMSLFSGGISTQMGGQSPKVLVISKGGYGTKNTVLRMLSLRINDLQAGHGTMVPPNYATGTTSWTLIYQ